MLRNILCCFLLLQLATGAAYAQVSLYSPQQTAIYYQLDSVFKGIIAWQPDAGLLTSFTAAYRTVTRSSNPLIAGIDSECVRTGMTPPEVLAGIARQYCWKGLFEAVRGGDSGIAAILPVADRYNSYLCACMNPGNGQAPFAQYGKIIKAQIDSCKKNIMEWSAHGEYRRAADSAGKQQLNAHSRNEYLAYLLKTCPIFRNTISGALTGLSEYTPREQRLVRLNAFHNDMYQAVSANKPDIARKYAAPADLQRMQTGLSAAIAALQNKQAMIRMAFYNETGMFYFLAAEGGRYKVLSRLSYHFDWQDNHYKISGVAYELRKALVDQTPDEYIAQHFFRYPLPVFDYNGFPRGELLLQTKRVSSSPVIEALKDIDITPY